MNQTPTSGKKTKMSSDHDMYCSRCDVNGHRESSAECLHYWKTTEVPFKERMAKMIGKIVRLKDPAPILWDRDSNQFDAPPGTYVRLTDYTPDTPGMKAGNYWSIQTLDGKYSAGQIYQDEFEVLTVLDRIALIGEEDATG